MTKMRLFFFFFILILNCHLQSKDLNHSYSAMECYFKIADLKDRDFLINFAVESNDIYQTRSVSKEIARKVFDIPEIVFKKGVVEILILEDKIIGFYTLKPPALSDDWFMYELGHLFVKKGWQNQGFGSLLFNRVIEVASKKGWKKLEWFSDPDAKSFYLKKGALITGSCENLLNPDVDLSIFEYNL